MHRNLDCVYEPHIKTHKTDLIREIELLRKVNLKLQNRNRKPGENVNEDHNENQYVREDVNLQRAPSETDESMDFHGEPDEHDPGRSHQAIVEWLAREKPDLEALGLQRTTRQKLTDVVKLFESQYQDTDTLHRSRSKEKQVPWTNVTSNERFIGHLFSLYFTWVHPHHILLSEPDFKNDFHSNKRTNCSISLVNAICAMACNLLEPMHGQDRQNALDISILRDGFMDEARKSLLPNAYWLMTSKQAFAVMSVVEMSSGKARSAMGYLRSAIDNERFRDGTQQSEAARELTVWGIQTLNS